MGADWVCSCGFEGYVEDTECPNCTWKGNTEKRAAVKTEIAEVDKEIVTLRKALDDDVAELVKESWVGSPETLESLKTHLDYRRATLSRYKQATAHARLNATKETRRELKETRHKLTALVTHHLVFENAREMTDTEMEAELISLKSNIRDKEEERDFKEPPTKKARVEQEKAENVK